MAAALTAYSFWSRVARVFDHWHPKRAPSQHVKSMGVASAQIVLSGCRAHIPMNFARSYKFQVF